MTDAESLCGLEDVTGEVWPPPDPDGEEEVGLALGPDGVAEGAPVGEPIAGASVLRGSARGPAGPRTPLSDGFAMERLLGRCTA